MKTSILTLCLLGIFQSGNLSAGQCKDIANNEAEQKRYLSFEEAEAWLNSVDLKQDASQLYNTLFSFLSRFDTEFDRPSEMFIIITGFAEMKGPTFDKALAVFYTLAIFEPVIEYSTENAAVSATEAEKILEESTDGRNDHLNFESLVQDVEETNKRKLKKGMN